ncbi:MAG TPA: helix-turn-helix transcriptional regulator [Lacunisphaera sp.]|nr:helix-turn-helix transcriptional regulator [Lacunisphaera sp.]
MLLFVVKVPKRQKVRENSSQELQIRLGNTIRSERRRLGVTQEELAWRADLHRTYLADIERGVRNITLKSIANLARALGVSAAHLLDKPEPQTRTKSISNARGGP